MQITTRETITINQNYDRDTVLEINFTKQDKVELIKSIIEEDGVDAIIEALDIQDLVKINEYYKDIEDDK